MRVVIRTSRTDSVPRAGNAVRGHFSTVAAVHGAKVTVRQPESGRLPSRHHSAPESAPVTVCRRSCNSPALRGLRNARLPFSFLVRVSLSAGNGGHGHGETQRCGGDLPSQRASDRVGPRTQVPADQREVIVTLRACPIVRPMVCVRAFTCRRVRGRRDGTTSGTITHGDGSPAVRARQRPRLTWIARPAPASSRRCR
jgi:hypothetical protein